MSYKLTIIRIETGYVSYRMHYMNISERLSNLGVMVMEHVPFLEMLIAFTIGLRAVDEDLHIEFLNGVTWQDLWKTDPHIAKS